MAVQGKGAIVLYTSKAVKGFLCQTQLLLSNYPYKKKCVLDYSKISHRTSSHLMILLEPYSYLWKL